MIEEPSRPSDASAPQPHLPALSWPAWAFIAGAVMVVLARLSRVSQVPPGLVATSTALSALADGLIALLPAALLMRVPEAPRRLRLLLAGLAGQAVAVWGWTAIPVLLSGPQLSSWLVGVAFTALYGLQLAASVSLGLGLLGLRPRGARRLWLLAAIAALEIGLAFVQVELPAAYMHQSFLGPTFVPIAALTAAGAFAAWVPVDAWLGHELPRPFWALLALGFPLGIASSALGVGEILEMLTPQATGPATHAPYLVAGALVSLVGITRSVLALAAYARLTPTLGGVSR